MPADAIIGHKRTFNLAAPGANTNIYSTGLTPTYPVSSFRVTVVLATGSVFNVMMTQGATTFTCGMDESNALNAGDLYSFVFPVNNATTYNFQVETDSIIRILQVDEVPAGVV